MLDRLKKDLFGLRKPGKARGLMRFFKTGKGEYGEGDVFIGVMVPDQRLIVKKYRDLSMGQVEKLLHSKIHEHRLVALLILVDQYKRGDDVKKKTIVDLYLKNTKHINNWDLVDLSARDITGAYYFDKEKTVLYKLTRSKDLWERRIAALSTFYFIKKNQFKDSLNISRILLKDKHDLIHKAVGWMLREIGKRDQKTLEIFLKKYYKIMPRTMLRYAIEKLNDNKRKLYLGI